MVARLEKNAGAFGSADENDEYEFDVRQALFKTTSRSRLSAPSSSSVTKYSYCESVALGRLLLFTQRTFHDDGGCEDSARPFAANQAAVGVALEILLVMVIRLEEKLAPILRLWAIFASGDAVVFVRWLCLAKTPSLLHDKDLCRLRLGTLSS